MKIKKGEIKHTFKPKNKDAIDSWVGLNAKREGSRKLTVWVLKKHYDLLIAEAASETAEKGEKVFLRDIMQDMLDKHFKL